MKVPLLKIFFACVLSWTSLLIIIFHVPPVNVTIQILFLSLSFFTLSTTLTVIIFSLSHLIYHRQINRNYLFKEALRRSFLISFTILIIALLKLMNAESKESMILLILTVLAIEIYWTEYLS